MADHFLETPEYEQSKNLGLVYLKGAESVKIIISKYVSLVVWSGLRPATFTPPNQNSWIRPCLFRQFAFTCKAGPFANQIPFFFSFFKLTLVNLAQEKEEAWMTWRI